MPRAQDIIQIIASAMVERPDDQRSASRRAIGRPTRWPGDFDAIGRDEPAVYRASTGQFLVYNPVTGQTETSSIKVISTGVSWSSSSPDLASAGAGPRASTTTLTYYQNGR